MNTHLESEEKKDGSQTVETKLDYRMPIYLQLREIVRSKIEEGEYLPGTAIPSENKLAETFGINRLTVRNAVDALVNEGLLHRVQGKGVFVVGNKYEKALDEEGGFIGTFSGGSGHKRISIKEQTKMLRPAGNKYANHFNIGLDDLIFYIRHFVTLDNESVFCSERDSAGTGNRRFFHFYHKRHFCFLRNRALQHEPVHGNHRRSIQNQQTAGYTRGNRPDYADL